MSEQVEPPAEFRPSAFALMRALRRVRLVEGGWVAPGLLVWCPVCAVAVGPVDPEALDEVVRRVAWHDRQEHPLMPRSAWRG